jgi:acyl-CoA thioester hydrolase
MISTTMRGRIRWADADSAGRLHFPRMFEYFEDAESQLLQAANYNQREHAKGYDFPRVHVECQFKRVLPVYAEFFMLIRVGKIGHSSIRYEYRVFADEVMTELALEGSMTVVAVKDGEAVSIPESMRRALEGDAG